MEEPIPGQGATRPQEHLDESGQLEDVVYGTAIGEPEEQSEPEQHQETPLEASEIVESIGIAQTAPQLEPELEGQPGPAPEGTEDEVAVKAQRRVSKLPMPRSTGGYGSLRPPVSPGIPKPPSTSSLRASAGRTVPAPKTTAPPKASSIARPTVATSTRKPAIPPPAPAKTSSSTLNPPSAVGRRISSVSLRAPPAPAPVKKPSAPNLRTPTAPTRKPSNSRLTAPSTPTVARKPSASSLTAPPITVAKRASTSQLSAKTPVVARKPSSSTLTKPTAGTAETKPGATVKPKKSYGMLTSKPPGSLDPKVGLPPRRVTSALPPAAMKGPLAKVAAPAQKRQVSTPIRTAPKAPKPPPRTPQPPKENVSESATSSPKKTSLRDAIAAARKARKESVAGPGTPNGNVLDTFNFEIADPFNLGIGNNAGAELLKRRIASARTEGRLNISNMELKGIPADVYKMYEVPVDSEDGARWYDSIDLTKLIIADNEIESIGDELVKTFGMLQSIDAHNNLLGLIPSNWDRLNRLVTLNLSNNKLQNDALKDILSITTLVDLKLSKNNLTGTFPSEISNCTHLEVLEIYQNEIEFLPESISELHNLRTLNASSNKLESIPSLALKDCHLVELNISNNRIKGTLFDNGATEFPHLQTLDIKSNRISALTEGTLLLPALQQLYGSNNEMESLPNMEGWNELITIVCDYNHIAAIPEGLVTLEKLKRLDFTGNALSALDPQMAHMDSLEVIKLDSNPMKERSFTTMSASEIRRVLRERFAPEEIEPEEPIEKKYEIRPGGLLDLSNKGYEEIPADLFDAIASSPSNLILTRNSLLTIPSSLSTFASLTNLNLSHNKLSGTLYIPEKITLRSLNTLVLNANNISSIVPLVTNLEAPRLSTLDISANRITSITGLRAAFPLLTVLFAQLNQVEEIDVDAVDGMRILDLSSNSISQLPPKLGNVMTLRDLKVEGNLFKTPRWQVLSKGTEAVLSWLRDKIPIEDEEN